MYVICATETTINILAPHVNMNETKTIMSGTKVIPLDDRLMNNHSELMNKGVYVTADKPISIYVIEDSSYVYATEGYLALPTSEISTEYVVVTDICDRNNLCQFVIAALELNTTVNVTFKTSGTIQINGKSYSSGNVFTLEMSSLDTFQVQHDHDLTGTFIKSNKPIAIFSGCKCGTGRLVGGVCQHEVEQIVPVRSLGQEYITVPLFPAASYRYRIIAPYNNTIASINGNDYTIESGNFLERWDTDPIYIHTSKPVMVIEYGQCFYGECETGSDPSMITILSINTFFSNFKFGIPETLSRSEMNYYLLVVIKSDKSDVLMLDNQSMGNKYKVMTSSIGNYSILVAPISSGYHTLHHPDPFVRFGALFYGTGKYASIGFPLGYHSAQPIPDVILVPSSTNSITILLTTTRGYTHGYEVKGTPMPGGNTLIQRGIFHSNQTAALHNFTTLDPPGTCFKFEIVTTTWYGILTSGSEPVFRDNVGYDPSKLSVTFVPKGTQTIMLTLTIVDGKATGFEISAESITGGNTYAQNGTFLHNQTTLTYNFTTSDLTGTCFKFRVIATSGFGQWAGSSEPVVEPHVCFDISFISRPVVRPEIHRLRNDTNRLIFYCDFHPLIDTSVLYLATWYRDKIEQDTILMSSLNYFREDIRSGSYLSETEITLGMTILCTIYVIQQNITVPSEPYFVGFEVMFNDTLTIQNVAETWVHIRLTVPFACHIQNEECFLGMNMFYNETGADNCLVPSAAALTSCGIRISSSKWNESYAVRIVPMHGQNLISISRTYNIFLRTDVTFAHDFFRNYTLPRHIQVEVSTDTSNLNGKECHAICDPHMLTFDGRYYENQNEGTYILYKHLKSPIQVQMRTNRCYGFPEGPPFCPCGVAIAAGRDVFVVDRCSIPITIYMPQCDDGTLQGKIKNAGNFYQIYLPSGSWVKVTSGIFFNIYIYPSISDRVATSGLCGYLDGNAENDFMLRNRTTVPDSKFEEFNSNWLVKPEEDLFNISNYKSLKSWPREDYLCICGHYQDDNGSQSEKCSPDSRKFCPESGLNDSLATDCNITLSVKPNAKIELDPSDFNVNQIENDTTMDLQPKTNFTENSATQECWSYLNSSLLFAKCSKFPEIDPTSFAKTCAKDALITNTIFWAPTHMDNAQKRCIYQVTVKQPLPEEIRAKYNITSNSDEQTSNKTSNGNGLNTPISLQELKDLSCQCHCNKGYGSDDCSVDLTKPPDVYGIPNRGVCNLHESSCLNVTVLGNNFAVPVLGNYIFCRLSPFQVKANKTIFHDISYSHHPGKWISFAEVSCPVVDSRSKRSVQLPDDLDTLAIGYRVAVGNSRNIFGRDISLLVVDSLCVDCIKSGFDITCTLKEGFYLINRRCNKIMSADKKEESGSTVLIISSVLGSVLVVIVICGLLYYCLIVRTSRRKGNKIEITLICKKWIKKDEYYRTAEEVYDGLTDSPNNYLTIHDIFSMGNKLKDIKTNCVNLRNTQKNASEGYSTLNKLRNDESEGSTYINKEPGIFTAEATVRYQMRPLLTVYDK
ncbi:hypothetical protein ACJMK2_021455 [Sinanodonta woodiana]|uniref:VWFD domain-containing protein n=1 Tax=Sinanodonta woodiana TaxID=1069815 RepID=A0ABD3TG49_SINWO